MKHTSPWILPGLVALAIVAVAAVPAFTDFNTGQFTTTGNKVSLSSSVTNAWRSDATNASATKMAATNGEAWSPTLHDAAFTGTNHFDQVVFTNLTAYHVVYVLTNDNPEVITAPLVFANITTNASFTVSGFSGLVAGQVCFPTRWITNSAATEIVVTAPPNATLTLGSTNELHIGAGKTATVMAGVCLVRTNWTTVLDQ